VSPHPKRWWPDEVMHAEAFPARKKRVLFLLRSTGGWRLRLLDPSPPSTALKLPDLRLRDEAASIRLALGNPGRAVADRCEALRAGRGRRALGPVDAGYKPRSTAWPGAPFDPVGIGARACPTA